MKLNLLVSGRGNALRKHLSDAKIEEMIAPYTKERLWASDQAAQNLQQVQQYQIKTANFLARTY